MTIGAGAWLILAGMAAASARDTGDRLLDSAPTVSSDMATPSGSHLRAATVTPAPEGNGLPAARSHHGDWTLRCSPAKKSENCAVTEGVVGVAPDTDIGLTVLFLKGSGSAGLLMRVQAPGNVLLPSGLGLYIDGDDIGRAGYVRCPANGCIAEVQVDDALLAKLRNGRTATFVIFLTPEEGIGIPISLNGLGEAIQALP